CESGLSAHALAPLLVRQLGLPAVVAMTHEVSFATADALARHFYTSLRGHGHVDRALAEALVAVPAAPDLDSPAVFSRLGTQ
ncbi:CHAT domain-containing protein, partial [Escherichia coli]